MRVLFPALQRGQNALSLFRGQKEFLAATEETCTDAPRRSKIQFFPSIFGHFRGAKQDNWAVLTEFRDLNVTIKFGCQLFNVGSFNSQNFTVNPEGTRISFLINCFDSTALTSSLISLLLIELIPFTLDFNIGVTCIKD